MTVRLWRDKLVKFFETFMRRFRPRRPLYVEDYRVESLRPIRRSRSLALPLILLGVFLGSVVFTLVRERGRVRGERAFQVLSSVEDDLAAARDLVGLDDRGVRERLSRARESLEQARGLGLSRRRVDLLAQEIDEIGRKLERICEVSSRLVYDLSSQGRGVVAADLAIDASSWHLLVLDREQEQVFRIILKEEGRPQVEKLPLKIPSSARGLDFSEETGLVWGEREVLMFDGGGEPLGKIPLDSFGDVVDVKGYAGSVYILSSSENQIFKFSSKPWLKERLEIEDSSRVAIDGDIYLWVESTLRRFRRGMEIDFFLKEEVGTPLTSPRDVVVWAGSAGIYILDSENLRVLKFSKDGALLGQYVDSGWDDLRALAISGDETKGYVLSGNRVLEFEMDTQ